MMYTSVPSSLIWSLGDPYGPNGIFSESRFSGRKPPRPSRLRRLGLFLARRSTPDTAPQPSPAQICCASHGRPAM